MFGLDVDTLQKIKEYMASLPNIHKVIIYGSRAKGNYKSGSDIDITLLGDNLTLQKTVYPLQEMIEQSTIPYRFDISIFTELKNSDLIEHILRVGKTLYQKEKK